MRKRTMVIGAAAFCCVVIAFILIVGKSQKADKPASAGTASQLRPGDETQGQSDPAKSMPVGRPAGFSSYDSLDGAVDRAIGEMGDASTRRAMKRVDAEAEGAARATQLAEVRHRIWDAEDRVLAEMPQYATVRGVYLAKAQGLLQPDNEGLPSRASDLAQKELDAFWNNGGLESKTGYEHAYLARAMLEIAVDRQPDDFALLSALRESVATVTPLVFADSQRNDAIADLKAVVDRQWGMIAAGQVVASPDAMCAAYDWITLTFAQPDGLQASIPAWQWLVAHADTGGWMPLKAVFERGLAAAQSGTALGANLYAYSGEETPEQWMAIVAHSIRRLPSFRGSPQFRSNAVCLWQEHTVNRTVIEHGGH